MRTWRTLVASSVSAWLDDYAPSMGAALSYYTVFSLAPLLLIVVSVAGLAFGEEAVRGELFAQLQGLMGRDAAQAVQGLLASASRPSHGVLGTIAGIAIVVFGATTVFAELQDDLDRIWRAPARKKGGPWSLLRARLLSFGMILGLAFLLMVSLVLGAVISALGKWWGPMFGGWVVLAQGVNILVGFGLTTIVFAMIYKMMPRVHVQWHDVWLGALVTALLFTVGKFLIGIYIGKSGIASGFGAAASLVIVFLWVYYSAQIFLLGAEFTWVYARTLGSMQDVATAEHAAGEKAAAADQKAPTRSDPGRRDDVPAVLNTAVAGATADARSRAAGTRPASSIGDVGAGVALLLALRFALPRLLRRL
ncbi:MAG TPA: YihY/virulence factor BrkB family protein [Caldimonas sp.]|nr:YihY/virulence factor BrkB family protein [Caldimonas sp.]HEX4234072.1 YihY/virulence factor BrkB family protein [Caldimonas sp.]